jgi:hypothetical protein
MIALCCRHCIGKWKKYIFGYRKQRRRVMGRLGRDRVLSHGRDGRVFFLYRYFQGADRRKCDVAGRIDGTGIPLREGKHERSYASAGSA